MSNDVALIADDDEFFRLALRTILIEAMDFGQVVETASLDEAIEQLTAREGISLALFDLAMPGMESPASLRAVREFDENVKVAVVSASTRRQDVLVALEAGVHGYVPKGLGAVELTAALKSIVSGNIYVPSSISETEHEADGGKSEVSDHKTLLKILTPRQRDVLQLLIHGHSNKMIARELGLGEGTIKIHLAALFRSLGVSNRSAAAVMGSRLLSEEGSADDQ